jgi:hypothetical protein
MKLNINFRSFMFICCDLTGWAVSHGCTRRNGPWNKVVTVGLLSDRSQVGTYALVSIVIR